MRLLIAALCLGVIFAPCNGLAEGASTASSREEAKPGESVVTEVRPPESSSLLQDLDALFLLQDATAAGRKDAAALQKRLIVSIGEKLAAGNDSNPDQMTTFLVGYILSGGDPATADAVIKSEQFLLAHRRLLEGVSLFMRGEGGAASKLLSNVDTSFLPARIAGRVALAQALLNKEPASRQDGLSRAIASMPGTLVEESALRRSALAFAESAQEESFWNRIERYQRRFPDSLYAAAFWEEVLGEIVGWSANGKAPDMSRLDLILQVIPVSRRRDLYIHLARQSARANNESLIEFAARRALRLAVSGSQEEQTARLYLSLYSIVSERGDAALADLGRLNRSLLGLREQALLDAGMSLAHEINRPAAVGPEGAGVEPLEKSPLEKRAESLLIDIEKMIEESNS